MTTDEALNVAVQNWLDDCKKLGLTFDEMEATQKAWDASSSIPFDKIKHSVVCLATRINQAAEIETEGEVADWQVFPLLVMKIIMATLILAGVEKETNTNEH